MFSVIATGRIRLEQLSRSIVSGAPVVSASRDDGTPAAVLHPRDLVPPGPPPVDSLERGRVQATARRNRALVRPGDVVVTARGTQLRSAVVPPETEGAIASANLLVVRLGDRILPEVLVAYLDTPAGSAELLARATASTVGAFVVTPKALASLDIAVPPMAVQTQLASFVRAARQAIVATERLVELRKELVHGVVQQVFEGRELSLDAGVLQ